MRTLAAAVLLAASLAAADVAPEEAPPAPPPVAPLKHPEGIERAVAAAGVIQGGWEYVYAAYTLGTLGILGFAASLFLRRPKSQGAPS